MTEIIEISIDLVNKKISLVYPDSTTDEIDLPEQAFIKIIGNGPFRDVVLWQAKDKQPEIKTVKKTRRKDGKKNSKLQTPKRERSGKSG